MTLDLDAIAREAGIDLDQYGGIARAYPQHLQRFAALLLEKAAQEEMQPGIYSKHDFAEHLRAMSAALQSGDRG